MTASYVMDGYLNPPAGVRGGSSPALPRAVRRGHGGEEEDLPPVFGLTLTPGESLIGLQSGGGGYGDPFERDPELVRQDVLRRWVSFERARSAYGVVFVADVLADSLKVDQSATEALRAELSGPRS